MPVPAGCPSGKCTACAHSERQRIEMLISGGVSFRAASRKFGLSRHVLERHFKHHVSAQRRAQLVAGGGAPLQLHELAEKAADLGLSLLDYLGIVRSGLLEQFLAATEAGDRNGCASVAGKLLEALRMQAQLSGDLQRVTAPVTNNVLVMNSPLMADLQSMLITRLRPYPDASRAVLDGLRELSARVLPGTASAPAMIEGAAVV
jgi:hypothetical protein